MKKTPVVFVGHGSPMNAIEHNAFTAQWETLGVKLGNPRAILAVSAHWFTRGTRVFSGDQNRTIYDMYGFPDALYRIRYDAPASPALAQTVATLLPGVAQPDAGWGLDHGTWSVLTHVFPKANIPVLQLSVDQHATPAEHFRIGQALASLREDGVLIFASGNVVHNLGLVDFSMPGGFDWAQTFDDAMRQNIEKRVLHAVIDYLQAGACARLAVPTMDHFAPLLYALGATDNGDAVEVFNAECGMGSLSMTSYLFG